MLPLSLTEIFWGFTAIFTLFNITWIIYRFAFHKRFIKYLAITIGIINFGIALEAGMIIYQEFGIKHGVLIVSETQLRQKPSPTAIPLFILHDGIQFKVVRVAYPWSEIQLANGFQGYIKRSEFWVY